LDTGSIWGKVSFDLTAGYEVGYCLDAREKGDATASNSLKYSVSGERETIKVDIRPELNFQPGTGNSISMQVIPKAL